MSRPRMDHPPRVPLEETRREAYPAPPPRLRIGDALDAYKLRAEIAGGATATIYRADDLEGGREVALKVLSHHLAVVPAAVERFRKEAELASRLFDPCVITVHAQGHARDHHYYAMELLSGEAADSLLELKDAPGTTGERFYRHVAFLFAGIARALGKLHAAGVVHRDVKPENLLVGSMGQLVLCDFGSAVERREETPAKDEMFWGTVRYMSPDQFLPEADPRDPRLDVYSLGVTLYEIATGRSPFPRCPPEELVRIKLSRRPPAPRVVDPRLPLSLEAIVRQAMEPDPRFRQDSAAELADDLERFATARRGHRR